MRAEITIRSVWAARENEERARHEMPLREEEWTGYAILEEETTERRLEEIFRQFNRVDEADVERLTGLGYRLPSLSVGDTVALEGRVYEVAGMGFKEVTEA